MITTEKDPKTRKEFLLAAGVVTAVYINEVKEPKTFNGPNGPWTPTKGYKVVIDNDAISLGLGERDSIGVKDEDGKYHNLAKGMEISITVEATTEYKGKMQYQARASDAIILSLGDSANPVPAASNTTAYKPKDMTGVQVGHSINGAMNFLTDGFNEYSDLVDAAKAIHDITDKVKASYKAANPSFSEYDIGAASGNAVLNACKLTDNLEDIEGIANEILNEVVPNVLEYIKPAQKKEAAPKKAAAPKKTPSKTAPKKVASVETPPETEGVTNLADMDDDIPFN